VVTTAKHLHEFADALDNLVKELPDLRGRKNEKERDDLKSLLGRIASAAMTAADRVGKAPPVSQPTGGFDVEDWGGIIAHIGFEEPDGPER
jgi:ABC-type transporter Mla subunit MlaD